MTRTTDREYLLRREREERARAEACKDVAARRAHLNLARCYRDRATTGSGIAA